jgi:hypothetical protein
MGMQYEVILWDALVRERLPAVRAQKARGMPFAPPELDRIGCNREPAARAARAGCRNAPENMRRFQNNDGDLVRQWENPPIHGFANLMELSSHHKIVGIIIDVLRFLKGMV